MRGNIPLSIPIRPFATAPAKNSTHHIADTLVIVNTLVPLNRMRTGKYDNARGPLHGSVDNVKP